MEVIMSGKIPIKTWANDIEDGALEQALNLSNLPFAFKHIALMPDCHQGYGMPIGGVMATRGVVVPNAVGVDIGCGMCSVATSCNNIEREQLVSIMKIIRETVPVGFSHHQEVQDESLMPNIDISELPIAGREYQSALKQIGTLGGGNHFVEIQRSSLGGIAIMIHSGSRNIGYKVARHYNNIAKAMNKRWFTQVPEKWDIAFLPLQSAEGQRYLVAMQYCVDFALANRKLIMDRVKAAFLEVIKECKFTPMINIAHNYAAMENHYGQNVMVHRKGATRAYAGEIGIIPGSQGASSYIVEGLGNPMSFKSCSHGAGRRMGRKEAQRVLDLDTEIQRMCGILHNIKETKDLDEAPGAYKDIDEVMRNQGDLVKIIERRDPLAVIKG